MAAGDGAGAGAAGTGSTVGSERFVWRGFRFAWEAPPVFGAAVRLGFGGTRHVFDSGGPFPSRRRLFEKPRSPGRQ
jgi:hypothetical protein